MNGTAGVLLAAGRGRRMGALKQLLPFGTGADAKPLVAAAFDALAPACDFMVVVVGSDQPAVLDVLSPRKFTHVVADPDAEMFESVRAGLKAAREERPGCDVLLHPADHPIIRRSTLETILAAARPAHRPTKRPLAVMPEHGGKGGHPVFISSAIIPAIVAWQGPGGLRAFWEIHTTTVIRLPVNDASILFDLDTPQDLERTAEFVSRAHPEASS